MTYDSIIPVQPMVDELIVLPEVDSAEALLQSKVSCRFQILPGSAARIADLFPTGNSTYAGEALAPAWWDEGSALDPVFVIRIIGAFYFPNFGVLISEAGGALSMTAQQALYTTPDLMKLPCTYSQGGETWFRVPSDLESIEAAAITMPYGSLQNYGHFVLDCLPSIPALRNAKCLNKHKFVFPELTHWQQKHLDLLDVDVPRKHISDVIHIDDAIYTSCMKNFLHHPNTLYRDLRRLQLAKLPAPIENERKRKIYLSRTLNPKRVFLSELELQSRLGALGFEIASPETMSVEDQITLFREAEVVVGHTGAAFANVLYCAPGTLVVETQPDRMQNWWVRKLCALIGCRHDAYFSNSKILSQEHPESGLEFDFNVEKFMSHLSTLTETNIASKPEAVIEPPPESWAKSLSRSDVLNHILALFEKARYLEIGVYSGETFFAAKADTKVAVDPNFAFNVDDAKLKHKNSRFYAVESDVFFGDALANERFDLIYIDGLHTVEQTLRDFCNAIEVLKEDGIIVIDDVVPNSYHASLPDLATALRLRSVTPGADENWMGDVYRLVFFIDTFFQQYQYATVIENHGQLVVWKRPRRSNDIVHRTIAEIGNLPFEKTITESDVYKRRPFGEIMWLLRHRRDRP